MAQTGLLPANNVTPADSQADGSRPSVPSVAELVGFAAYMLVVGANQPDYATLFTTLGRALSGQPLDDVWAPVVSPASEVPSPALQPAGAQLDCDSVPAPLVRAGAETDWLLVAAAARAAAASF